MRVLANGQGLLFACDGVCVPDSEDFAATGMAKNVQAVAPAVMEFFGLGRLGPHLSNSSVGQHGTKLLSYCRAWTIPAGAKIFGGICTKAKPLPFVMGGNHAVQIEVGPPLGFLKESAGAALGRLTALRWTR